MKYYVEIIKHGEPEEIVKRLGPYNERDADRADDGINRQLNHEQYYTLITEEQE